MDKIKELAKNSSQEEKANVEKLCKFIIESNMDPEEQESALMKI